ncbi:hypothetical protein [uncultured Treponema sp.]|uniref:hypothetical protein n=1 Tax=uncultured Treponema sp. TaxID=162155 RepID=UPI0025CE44C4|nr:hypothetical protein [uncultured Treponema sp.]
MNQNKNTAYTMLGIAGMAVGLVAAVRIFTEKNKTEMKNRGVSKLAEYGRTVESYYYTIKSDDKDIKSQTRYSTNFRALSYDIDNVVKFFKKSYPCFDEQRYSNGRLLSCSFIISRRFSQFIVIQGVNYGKTTANITPSNRVQVAYGLNVFEYLHR